MAYGDELKNVILPNTSSAGAPSTLPYTSNNASSLQSLVQGNQSSPINVYGNSVENGNDMNYH